MKKLASDITRADFLWMRISFLFCLFLLEISCSKSFSPIENLVFFDEKEYVVDSVFSNDVLNRAYQMASVKWTPLNKIPLRDGVYYEPGKQVSGIPYSSVKEINTYLFQDVSYHTFMTAVHNPKSVLYTEDISKEPYHGLNCAPYYGAVCSSAVMYALGFRIPYYTSQIINLESMQKLNPQIIDSLKVCDVIWKPGHVQLIFDVEHRADTLYRISTFESNGRSAHIRSHSKAEFKNIWKKEGYVGYRFKYLIYSKEPVEFIEFDPIVYNEALCPSKGDKAVYRTDDAITINIFTSEYDTIVLTKDSIVIESGFFQGGFHYYTDLQPGIYEAFLQKNDKKSDPVSFEVIDADVRCSWKPDGESLELFFNTSEYADYAVLCDLSGSSSYFPISDGDRERGYTVIPLRGFTDLYCKVVFRGEYGTMINRPIKVN